MLQRHPLMSSQGWQTREGDQYFQDRRTQADNADKEVAQGFFKMTCEIGRELDKETSVITLATQWKRHPPRVLDMGMAPGGFSATVLRKSPTATIRGITLPKEMGGLEVMLRQWESDARVRIEFVDVTMLTDELGRPTTTIPNTHPDVRNFSSQRPFQNEKFDLVFCGAAIQRAHPRAGYREPNWERVRLTTSQLVVALQRLRDKGSLVLLMHRADSWDTIKIISTFSKFSNVRLFKPLKKHAVRSSFYMVATEVHPRSEDALSAILEWKAQWEEATFRFGSTISTGPSVSGDSVRNVLAEFGSRLIDLATPVWRIQADALRSTPFLRKSTTARILS
jgi:23S rRNA U2552 (ribose-2'-O)-methylase RlmE/FtsJ